ncbi:unnamed protein product, partial [Ectocarpus sp. 6 AP-2014]
QKIFLLSSERHTLPPDTGGDHTSTASAHVSQENNDKATADARPAGRSRMRATKTHQYSRPHPPASTSRGDVLVSAPVGTPSNRNVVFAATNTNTPLALRRKR